MQLKGNATVYRVSGPFFAGHSHCLDPQETRKIAKCSHHVRVELRFSLKNTGNNPQKTANRYKETQSRSTQEQLQQRSPGSRIQLFAG